MASALTYEGDVRQSEIPTGGGLFEGKRLWFSRAVPARDWLIQNAQNNGAQVVRLEQQADVKLVDHARKNQAPGTHSYKYVELSIRNGQLEDLDAHLVGSVSRADRPVGSVVTASKGTRNKFTDAEDQLLWNWIKPYADAGGYWKGNEIYKQLEAAHPNHTFQSWRDRWIRHTQYQRREITANVPQAEVETVEDLEENPRSPKKRKLDHKKRVTPAKANTGIAHTRREQTPSKNIHTRTTGHTELCLTDVMAESSFIRGNPISQAVKSTPEVAEQTSPEEGDVQIIVPSIKPTEAREHVSENPSAMQDDERSVNADIRRLPLAYDFTQIEAGMLYTAACQILTTPTDFLDESWSGVVKEYGHSEEAWRTYFYDVIVPEYKRRNNLTSDAELQLHCKRQVDEHEERRARKRALRIQQEENEAAMTRILEGVQQDDFPITSHIETDHEDLGPQSAQPAVPLASSTDEELDKSNEAAGDRSNDGHSSQQPINAVETFESQSSLPHPEIVFHIPPRPNESRKLSPSKGSQSISSQSRSQPSSHSLSQPSHRSQSTNSQVSQHAADNGQAPSQTLLTANNDNARTKEGTKDLPITQDSGDSGDLAGRFVTQVSRDERASTSENTSDLEDIPYRAPAAGDLRPLENTFASLFEPEQNSSALRSQNKSNDELPNLVSSSPITRLIEDDTKSDGDRYSDTALSDVPSEAVYFESQAELTEAWETAPNVTFPGDLDQPFAEANENTNFDEAMEAIEYELAAERLFNVQENGASVVFIEDADSTTPSGASRVQHESAAQTKQSTPGDFETAPVTLAVTESENGQASPVPAPNLRRGNNHRLDTQALFQRPVQQDLAELVAIPEPSGGWEDGDLEEDLNSVDANMVEDPRTEADWTMPLPDPDLDTQSLYVEDEDAGVDGWLASQSKIYSAVPALLLKPLSHRALESSCMDLEVANIIIASMVQRYEKGKYPADLAPHEIRKLPKKEQKSVVSRIVEELLPPNQRGCWTRKDDRALLSVHGRDIRRVGDKHGDDEVKKRFEFLEMWNA